MATTYQKSVFVQDGNGVSMYIFEFDLEYPGFSSILESGALNSHTIISLYLIILLPHCFICRSRFFFTEEYRF